MTYSKILLSTVCVLLISGCQYTVSKQFNANETATDWIGESPIALMEAKGNPTQVFNNEGLQYLIYMTADNLTFGDNTDNTETGKFTVKNGYPQAVPTGSNFCQQTYIVENGVIINAEQQGAGCVKVSDIRPD